jgi:ApbE superfamily uncharacterized protein (UPF0280 family)
LHNIFANRLYRIERKGRDLTAFTVTVKETNLFIQAEGDLAELATDTVLSLRRNIESYIRSRPEFAASLIPIKADPYAPDIVREMIEDSRSAGTGPMAAVAGAIAEGVVRVLSKAGSGKDVIVENGGDVFMMTGGERVVGLQGADALLNIGIVIPAGDSGPSGVGVSSSSAHFGESLSLGGCDLATVVARRGALSDAGATALGNKIKSERDINGALQEIVAIPDVIGAIAVVDGKIGIKGDITLVPLGGRT